MTIGERIREKRLELHLTQKELGSMANIAAPNLRKYELGKQNPKYETLEKIASALGVTAYYLQTGYEDSYSENIETTREGIMQDKEDIINFAKSYDEFSDFNDLYYVSQIIKCIKAKNRKIDSLETSLLEAQHKLNELS